MLEKYRINYINGVSTFPCVSILFFFNQMPKLSNFFYFGFPILFLFNQLSKLFYFLYFDVSTLFF